MNTTLRIIAIGFLIAASFPSDAATICREPRIEDYDRNESRAHLFVPTRTTTNATNLFLYIEKDQYENPYYHSNFRSLVSATGRHYDNPTKIGGKTDPVRDLDVAYAQIIYDNVSSANLQTKIADSQRYLRSSDVFINENVFEKGSSLITSDNLTRFVLVRTRGDGRQLAIIEKREREEEGGGVTYCDVIALCRDEDSDEFSICSGDDLLPDDIVSGTRQLLCRSY